MERVYIVGVGMTPFGKLLLWSVKDLVRQSTQAALDDAGCSPNSIEAAFFSNATQGHMEGQQVIRGEIALRAMGFESIPIFNVENACASGSSALNLAVQFIRAGEGDVALAVGAEKMYSEDRERMLSVFDGGWDVHTAEANKERLLQLGQGIDPPPGTISSRPYSIFMDVYAAFARFYMREFGVTQRQLAAVSAKNHRHSVHNPLSQYRKPYSIEEVLSAPPIAYPLTLPMCAPISDGAAAAIVSNEQGIKHWGLNAKRAVRVLASIVQSGTDRDPKDLAHHITARAARRAYEKAGIGPKDVSVAEVHDATAMGEIIQVENLGFCSEGEGGALALSGATALGGRIPVNPSGGLESKGHPVGATGLGQVHELVTQLRGEAGARQVEQARLAIAENGGGLYGVEEAVACVTILGR